jgi:hypothetical protein
MTTLKCPTTKTIPGEWEDVYSVQPVTATLWTEVMSEFHTNTTYYQTSGGGPEGGYFVKTFVGDGDTLNCAYSRVWRVSRSWYQPWRVDELKNVILEYEPEDYKAGKTARCRKVEVYSLRETRAIVDEHLLDGNATEIVKCLRDGLSSTDEGYKTNCLSIILTHFAELDKYLDLLRPGSSYKEVLESLARKEDGESSSEESDSESEAE